MKLHDESYQWIYDHIDDFKRALVTADYCRQHRIPYDDKARMNADDDINDYALSFLLIAMGEHLPKTLWSASDYSVLYGIIMDDGDELHIRDDQ